MKTEICYICKQEKSIKDFVYSKTGKNKKYYYSYCRNCKNEYMKEYRKQKPWIKTYENILVRTQQKKCDSYNRYKHIKVQITPLELKELWFRDKAYLMKRPSIDRKDSKGNYIYSNCRYMELEDNVKRNTNAKMAKEGETNG